MAARADIDRIQSYLRESARKQYEVVPLPPFTLFFHPVDAFKYFNYAIPDSAAGGDLAGVLAQLRREFSARGRTARFEFFEAFAPDLPATLREEGFVEEGRQWSMLCMPDTLREPPEVPGLREVVLSPDSPDEDLLAYLLSRGQGFNPQETTTPGQPELTQARLDFLVGGWQGISGLMDGEPAGVAAFGPVINGVTEVAGVATRMPFRRRGIAARLTWRAARLAFERGAQTACLTAADANAGHVYETIGFQPFSIMLSYCEPHAL